MSMSLHKKTKKKKNRSVLGHQRENVGEGADIILEPSQHGLVF